MIEIGKTLVSLDVITCSFSCDLEVCKGVCCVAGDSGAPLEPYEAGKLNEILPALRPYLREESVSAITEQGTSVIDADHDVVTPLINGQECAYVVFEQGIARCAIEKAYTEGAIDFPKPVSCHLYPVRIKKYQQFDAVNYDRWDICQSASRSGDELQQPVYQCVKDALVRHYGEDWYRRLEDVVRKLPKSFRPT